MRCSWHLTCALLLLIPWAVKQIHSSSTGGVPDTPAPAPVPSPLDILDALDAGEYPAWPEPVPQSSKSRETNLMFSGTTHIGSCDQLEELFLDLLDSGNVYSKNPMCFMQEVTNTDPPALEPLPQPRLFTFYLSTKLPSLSDALRTLRKMGLNQGIDIDTFLYSATVPCGSVLVVTTTTEDQEVASVYTYSCNGMLSSQTDSILLPLPALCCSSATQQPLLSMPPNPPDPPAVDYGEPPMDPTLRPQAQQQQPPSPAKRPPKPQLTLFVMTSPQNLYCEKLLLACETVAQPYGLTSGQYGCYVSTDDGLPVPARYGKVVSVPRLQSTNATSFTGTTANSPYVIVTALWPQRMYDRSFKRLQSALASSVEMFASLGMVPCGTEVRGLLLNTSGSVRREDAFGCLTNMPKAYKADLSVLGLRPVPRALLCCRPPPRPPVPPLQPPSPKAKAVKPPGLVAPPPPGSSGLLPSLDPSLSVPPSTQQQSVPISSGPRLAPPPRVPRPPSPGRPRYGTSEPPGALLGVQSAAPSSGLSRQSIAVIASLVTAAVLAVLTAAALLLYRRRPLHLPYLLRKAAVAGLPQSSSGRSSGESGGGADGCSAGGGGGGGDEASTWYGIGQALKQEGLAAAGAKVQAGGEMDDRDGGGKQLSTRPSGCSTTSSAVTAAAISWSGSGLRSQRASGLQAAGGGAVKAVGIRTTDPALITAAVDSIAIVHARSLANNTHARLQSHQHQQQHNQHEQQYEPLDQRHQQHPAGAAVSSGALGPPYGLAGSGSGFGVMDVFRDAAFNNSLCLSTATSAVPSAFGVGSVAALACSSWPGQLGGVYDNPEYQSMPLGHGPPGAQAQPPLQNHTHLPLQNHQTLLRVREQPIPGPGLQPQPPRGRPPQGAGGAGATPPYPMPYKHLGGGGGLPEAREVTLLELFNQSPLAGALLAASSPSSSSGGGAGPLSEVLGSEPVSRTASELLAREGSLDVLGRLAPEPRPPSGARQRSSPAIALERLSVQLATSIARLSGGVQLLAGEGPAAGAGASVSLARERRLALLLPDGDSAADEEEEEGEAEGDFAAGEGLGGRPLAAAGNRWRRATVGAAADGSAALSTGSHITARGRRWRKQLAAAQSPGSPVAGSATGGKGHGMRGGGSSSAGGSSSTARGGSDLGSVFGDLDSGSRSPGSESGRSGAACAPSSSRQSRGTSASVATSAAACEGCPGSDSPPEVAAAAVARAVSLAAVAGSQSGRADPCVAAGQSEASQGEGKAEAGCRGRPDRRGRRSGGGRATPAVAGGPAAALAAGSGPDISPKELRIQMDGLLGAGSFGSVYRGVYRGQPVAVKVLHHVHLPVQGPCAGGGGALLQQKDVESFRREIAILRMLAHPNIVRVLGGCAHAGHPFLVMELLPRCLHNVIHGVNGRLALRDALHIAAGVARGLAHLHPAIVHRDLKPANILLDADGTAKISDFGLARYHLKPYISTQQPDAGSVAYMAPEGFDPAIGRLSAKCDVYSFGVLLWELLTQEHPWSGESNVAIIYRVAVHRMRLPLPADPRVCPPRLGALLNACMSYCPADRPDMKHVLAELEDMLQVVIVGGVEALMLQALGQGQGAEEGGRAPSRAELAAQPQGRSHQSQAGGTGSSPPGSGSGPGARGDGSVEAV